MIFFKPTEKFMDWLQTYAGDRFIVDVGCGEGLLLSEMKKRKMYCLGIDPYETFIPDPERTHEIPEELIIRSIGERSPLIQKDNTLILIARPCHDGFASRVIKARNKKNEVLYIGLLENLEKDLDEDVEFEKLNVKSTGADSEIVLSIKG